MIYVSKIESFNSNNVSNPLIISIVQDSLHRNHLTYSTCKYALGYLLLYIIIIFTFIRSMLLRFLTRPNTIHTTTCYL